MLVLRLLRPLHSRLGVNKFVLSKETEGLRLFILNESSNESSNDSREARGIFLDSKKFPPVQDPRDWAKSELQVRRKRWMQEAMQEAKVPSVLLANFLLVKQRVGKWKDDRE